MTPPTDPTLSKRALDTIQVLASVAGSLGIVWAFIVKAGKPWWEWRKKRQGEIIREVLKPQLEALDRICGREEAAATQIREVFRDFDRILEVALDNRERLDEMNLLMDALGFASRDRRAGTDEERAKMEGIVESLVERRRARRRQMGEES